MKRIKVYDETDKRALENEMNYLIHQLEKKDKELIDIKYSICPSLNENRNVFVHYSALVIYDDKVGEIE